MKSVVVFCEGEYEDMFRKSDAEAQAFADGIVEGADLYGAGSCAVYVLPDHEASMVKEVHASDVTRALEAIAEAEEQERLADCEDAS